MLTPLKRSSVLAGTAAVAFWGHLTYPALLLTTARIRQTLGRGQTPLSDVPVDTSAQAPVPDYTVVIPAYLEAGEIAGAVSRWRANGATDIIVAVDADPETEAAAREAGATVSRSDQRGGKSAALNRAVPEVRTPIAILTDANTYIDRESALRMVSHIASGRADVVGGVKVEDLAESESRYWKFENRLKRSEEEMGGCPLLVGEAIALRPAQWEPLPSWVRIDDLYLATRACERGLKVRVDTSCLALEPSAPATDQHTRRVRNAAGVVDLVLRAPSTMVGTDLPRLMIIGHKIARLTVSPPAQIVLAAATLGLLPRRFGVPLAALQVAPIADYMSHVRRGETMDGLRGLVAQAAGMPPAVWYGSVGDLRRRRDESFRTWPKVAR